MRSRLCRIHNIGVKINIISLRNVYDTLITCQGQSLTLKVLETPDEIVGGR